jgi:hypothetical protein
VTTASTQGSDSQAVGESGPSLFDLVSAVVAGFLRDGQHEIARARGASGAIEVSVKVSLEEGEPRWSRGSVAFVQNRSYPKR